MIRDTWTPAAREVERQKWDAVRQALDRCLATHTALWGAVHARVTPLWRQLAEGKTFARKPSYGLRLFGADGATLVGMAPVFNYRTHTIQWGECVVELITEVAQYLATENPTSYYRLDRQVTVCLTPQGCRVRQYRLSVVEDVGTLVPILEQFLADPGAVLGRSSTYCAVCGRRLTDGQSQARGIGPECIQQVATVFGLRDSVVQMFTAQARRA
jgi:Family of unknown function (DUF6011)